MFARVDGPDATELHYRRAIARRAFTCALASFAAGATLFVPWHTGHPGHTGYADLGVWPAVILWILSGLALLASATGSRRLQLASGIAAIVVPILGGGAAVVLARVEHTIEDIHTAGGDLGFVVLLIATIATGVYNLHDPTVLAPPPAPLPRARARMKS